MTQKCIARRRRLVWHALAALVVVYGALLRLDAFVGKYGTLDRPAWARVMTEEVAPAAAALRPERIAWRREVRPYVGGDPIAYLAFARAMTSFYQPHVREPVFLAMTRAGLFLLDGQDAGISLASAAGSILAVLGVYLLGCALRSPPVGLIAAILMAIEQEAITWAPDGWRDDPFTASVLLSTWALLRLRETPTPWRGAAAGVLGGLACLTRITALSFLVPALAWIAVPALWRAARQGPARQALSPPAVRGVLAAAAALAIVVGPYLVSCAIAYGDPLIAINYHTRYYRYSEGAASDAPMSASTYVTSKLRDRPFTTIDTGFNGLFVQPFVSKWRGLEPWIRGLGEAASWLAIAGVAGLAFSSGGRLFLLVLLTSLVPYMFTWNIGGGNEWRFTMHAYPFYLLAAAWAVVRAGETVVRVARGRTPELAPRPWFRRAAAVLVVFALGRAAYLGLPWLSVRESIGSGASTSIETGDRDRLFYRDGWSRPFAEGITARVMVDERATLAFPLPERRSYDMVLRLDPVLPDRQDRFTLLFNRRLLGTLPILWDPRRVGSYRLHVPADLVRAGTNELTIVAEDLVAAAETGGRFGWLPPGSRLGFRIWYLRVIP